MVVQYNYVIMHIAYYSTYILNDTIVTVCRGVHRGGQRGPWPPPRADFWGGMPPQKKYFQTKK